jgi:hypothetical protein
VDSDAEAAAAEEEEVRALQAQQVQGMDDDDYALPGFSGAAEPSLEQQVAAGGRSAAAAAAAAAGGVEVETVAKDMEGLTSGGFADEYMLSDSRCLCVSKAVSTLQLPAIAGLHHALLSSLTHCNCSAG